MVKGLTLDGGVTIAAAIHSPSSLAFSLFDRVMVILRGGVVYFGEIGEAGWREAGFLGFKRKGGVFRVEAGREVGRGTEGGAKVRGWGGEAGGAGRRARGERG